MGQEAQGGGGDPVIFTRHACERYRQFHMLDRPTATEDDARQILERFGPTATRVGIKTHRGYPVWKIEALGIEIVAKNEDGTVTAVTVLPPPRFRGLTPLQAERVEISAQEAKARAEEAQREVVAAKAALAEHKKAAETVARAVGPSRQAAVKQTLKREQSQLDANIGAAHKRHQSAIAERDIICAVLKTMRMQMHEELDETRLKAALRAALRAARSVGATDVLEAVRRVDAGLGSDAFIDGES